MNETEEFQRLVDEELRLIKAEVRDGMPDWPWAFGFAFGPTIPPWDEEVNPA